MESIKQEVVFELPMFVRVHKDGHVERLSPTDFTPPSTDSITGVSSKDTVIVPESNITARVFLPKIKDPNKKLAVLVFFHGGGFVINTPFVTPYHNFVTKLVSEADVVAVSVDYRKAPEHPIPAAYEDSWAALKWVASHSNGGGPEPWLNNYADFQRVFLGGDSSGANIAHNLAMAAGKSESGLSIEVLGIALVHPYFWGSVRIGSEAVYPDDKALINRSFLDQVWPFICPSNPDNDDPRVNPLAENPTHLQKPHLPSPPRMALSLSRPIHRSLTNPSLIHLISSSSPSSSSSSSTTSLDDPFRFLTQPPQQQERCSFYFSDVKASLKPQNPQN